MRTALALILWIAVALSASAEDRDKPKCQSAEFTGRYQIVTGEKFGEKIPSESVQGSIMTVTADTIVLRNRDKKETYAASYKLEPAEMACRIVLTNRLAPNEGQVARGLIRRSGDKLQLIYAITSGDEPTEFKTKTKQLMFELVRLPQE